jgi:threonyl-tRNA synthetase
VFWHPKGWTLFQTMIGYMREKQRRRLPGGEHPEVLDRSSVGEVGPLEKFGENMF